MMIDKVECFLNKIDLQSLKQQTISQSKIAKDVLSKKNTSKTHFSILIETLTDGQNKFKELANMFGIDFYDDVDKLKKDIELFSSLLAIELNNRFQLSGEYYFRYLDKYGDFELCYVEKLPNK